MSLLGAGINVEVLSGRPLYANARNDERDENVSFFVVGNLRREHSYGDRS